MKKKNEKEEKFSNNLLRELSPREYYNLTNGDASTPDNLEKTLPKSVNIFLYAQNTSTNSSGLAFETIVSNTILSASVDIHLRGRGLGNTTQLTLKDDPLDIIYWDSNKNAGNIIFFHLIFKKKLIF